jgi:arylsulfatase
VPITYELGGGLVCGADPGSPVTPAYAPPFAFTGSLEEVTVDVSGELIPDGESEMRLILSRQ